MLESFDCDRIGDRFRDQPYAHHRGAAPLGDVGQQGDRHKHGRHDDQEDEPRVDAIQHPKQQPDWRHMILGRAQKVAGYYTATMPAKPHPRSRKAKAADRPAAISAADEALLDRFVDGLWTEHGLARNTLDSYRAD